MTAIFDHASFRRALAEGFVRQVFGPTRHSDDSDKAELMQVSPLQLYATGVLFPQKVLTERLEDDGEDASPAADATAAGDGDLVEVSVDAGKGQRDRGVEGGEAIPEREPLNLANEFSPSALGISFRLEGPAELVFDITFGTYHPVKTRTPHPRAGTIGLNGKPFPDMLEGTSYQRTHHQRSIVAHVGVLGSSDPIPIVSAEFGLSLHLTTRRRPDGTLVVSAMVVNAKHAGSTANARNEDAFFQVDLRVAHAKSEACFLHIDREFAEAPDDAEVASMELLYRHRRAFALGHGVAGDWNRDERLSMQGRTDLVCSAAVPEYDLKPIKPREVAHNPARRLNLSMSFLFDADGAASPDRAIIEALEALAVDYGEWIDAQRAALDALDGNLRVAALTNLANCEECRTRVLKGIEVLRSDACAMTAFRLMNLAMLVQQTHATEYPFRKLGTPSPIFPDDYAEHARSVRKWRPFQLAFILMNVACMTDAAGAERDIVDLIWFPTGGGKTEAYLGLAAFTICVERLTGGAAGTTVLMRYTLRLLTAQQFQRAAALTLALEFIRRRRELGADLGEAEISIGLWVGQSLSPNARDKARSALSKLSQNSYAQNPFQVLQCPWCGVDFTDKAQLGYALKRIAGSTERTVRFVCPDSACGFGASESGLPIYVVDEDIYEAPPTILIGTVDKFAQIAWDERVGRLFGLGTPAPPPALVIQDELHLISGPLGTIVGLYETAIDALCTRDGHKHKIVASTATIRRAQQQCRDLYARKAFEFPPQALRAGESYFAYEDVDSPGRLYLGFLGSAVKSHQTALVRACSPLLQGACVDAVEVEQGGPTYANPYGTLVWYFNSLRELGHAATLCVGDIPEFLKGLCHRLNIVDRRRYIREVIELTSRRNADEIPEVLQQLEIPWSVRPTGRPPVDVLLSTNMIAVGVDVARLGLIVMSGQPKSTSEYIQASSRVGRRHPGLVVTVYAQSKSRDRSHYERFVAYHQSLYRFVEPTSVTPFSPQARERGLRGVLIALARQLAGLRTPDMIASKADELDRQIETIIARISFVDDDELAEATEEIADWVSFWEKYAPKDYGRMGGAVSHQTLVYPFGSVPDRQFQRDAWPLLTSMRNVDGTSEGQVLNVYDAPQDAAEAD